MAEQRQYAHPVATAKRQPPHGAVTTPTHAQKWVELVLELAAPNALAAFASTWRPRSDVSTAGMPTSAEYDVVPVGSPACTMNPRMFLWNFVPL